MVNPPAGSLAQEALLLYTKDSRPNQHRSNTSMVRP